MYQSKVDIVHSRPQPTTVKELLRFLGFSNFYCQFIQGFSTVVAPPPFLLRGVPKHLQQTPEARSEFQALKWRFSESSILHHPDLSAKDQLRWTAQVLGWVLSYPNVKVHHQKSSPMLTSHGNWLWLRGIMTCEIENFSPRQRHSRNEGTGWKRLRIHFWFWLYTIPQVSRETKFLSGSVVSLFLQV